MALCTVGIRQNCLLAFSLRRLLHRWLLVLKNSQVIGPKTKRENSKWLLPRDPFRPNPPCKHAIRPRSLGVTTQHFLNSEAAKCQNGQVTRLLKHKSAFFGLSSVYCYVRLIDPRQKMGPRFLFVRGLQAYLLPGTTYK
jgi:hypothetical protein